MDGADGSKGLGTASGLVNGQAGDQPSSQQRAEAAMESRLQGAGGTSTIGFRRETSFAVEAEEHWLRAGMGSSPLGYQPE